MSNLEFIAAAAGITTVVRNVAQVVQIVKTWTICSDARKPTIIRAEPTNETEPTSGTASG